MDAVELFLATNGLRREEVIFVPFGSHVYGTQGPESDQDWMAIVPANRRAISGTDFRQGQVEIHAWNAHDFQQHLEQHQVYALEVWFMPDAPCHERFTFRLDRDKLRREWLRKSSDSWGRAKKKLRPEGEPHQGRKSLFHSLRILLFGLQIARQRRIVNYNAANEHWVAIRDSGQDDWPWFRAIYQPLWNDLANQFRRATKEDR